jgi:hypothetical protein
VVTQNFQSNGAIPMTVGLPDQRVTQVLPVDGRLPIQELLGPNYLFLGEEL